MQIAIANSVNNPIMILLSVWTRQVVQSQLYGCTYEFIKHYLKDQLDIKVTFVDSSNVQEFKAAIRPDTKVYLSES